MSAIMTSESPAVQEESPDQSAQGHEQGVQPPTFQELEAQIKEALAAYKQREKAIVSIRESLTKARKQEEGALNDSLTDTSPRLLDKIAKSRVEIEVSSRRLAVAEQSRAGGLESIAGPIRRLQSKLIGEIAALKAKRTKAHYEAIAKELDGDSVERFCISIGLGRGDLLWRLAALAPDVLALESLHPYLTWLHTNTELSLQKLESDAEALFKFVGPILEQIEKPGCRIYRGAG